VTFETVHDWLLSALPNLPGLVLDVGAGTGRDAVWLAAHGNEIVAVEPSTTMRKERQTRHPDPRIRWITDRLPGLEQTLHLGLSFDLLLLSAVWLLPQTILSAKRPKSPLARLTTVGVGLRTASVNFHQVSLPHAAE
jgi:hypothetical protein